MQLPYGKTMFDLRSIAFWADEHKPTQIEMNDGQYAWFAGLCSVNKRDFNGIPIVFTDAPKI